MTWNELKKIFADKAARKEMTVFKKNERGRYELPLVACCEDGDIEGNNGAIVGIMVMVCRNCGTSNAGNGVGELIINWNNALDPVGDRRINEEECLLN